MADNKADAEEPSTAGTGWLHIGEAAASARVHLECAYKRAGKMWRPIQTRRGPSLGSRWQRSSRRTNALLALRTIVPPFADVIGPAARNLSKHAPMHRSVMIIPGGRLGVFTRYNLA